MGAVAEVLKTVIQWGVFLGMIGSLGEATGLMAKKSEVAHKAGLVSLGKLNDMLTR